MTRITLQKNVLIHREVSTSIKYKDLEKALKGETLIEVKCISEFSNRRFKKIKNLGFEIESIVSQISASDSMEFAVYRFKRG